MTNVNLTVSALAAAPEVISGLASVAASVETDLTGHKTILQTAVDAGKNALTTLQNSTVTQLIGTKASGEINDAANTGEVIDAAIEPVEPAIEKAIETLEAFIAKYF